MHLIQMLPFSPVSEALLPEEWVRQQWPELERTRTEGWEDLVAADQATVDPAGAWEAALNCSAHSCWGSGTTLADTLYLHVLRAISLATSARKTGLFLRLMRTDLLTGVGTGLRRGR